MEMPSIWAYERHQLDAAELDAIEAVVRDTTIGPGMKMVYLIRHEDGLPDPADRRNQGPRLPQR